VLALVLASTTIAADFGPKPVQIVAQQAIAQFQPLWSPADRQLRGYTIVIHATEANAEQPRSDIANQAALMTAAHLYHFVKSAGGTALLTRSDFSQPPREVASPESAGLPRIAIGYELTDDGAPPGVAILEDDPAVSRWVSALAQALGAPVELQPQSGSAPEARPAAADHECWCEVRFAIPDDPSVNDVALRKRCLENARSLQQAIQSACLREELRPDSDTRTARPAGSRLERLARTAWPDGDLPRESVEWFCRRVLDQTVKPPNIVYTDVSTATDAAGLSLHLRTNAPELAGTLKQALQSVGVTDVDVQVERLPDRRQLDNRLWGVCQLPQALTYHDSTGTGLPQTQLLFGEPVFMLDRDADRYLALAADGYWGWVHRDALALLKETEFDVYMACDKAVVLEEFSDGMIRIPRGATVAVKEITDRQIVLLLPSGDSLAVPRTRLRIRRISADRRSAEHVRAALNLLYAPYVFGGRSPVGLDCSGLLSNVCAQSGHTPPRDAWQQAMAGRLVATAWYRKRIQLGDQLFFIDARGKVYHTAIALDEDHYIHSAPPCVKINSLDPNSVLYDARRARDFFIAKRPSAVAKDPK
jgi:hypothetical protein